MNAPRTHICNSIEVHLYLTKQMTTKQARYLPNHQQLFTLPRPTSSPQLINLNRNEYYHKKLFTIWTEARYLSITPQRLAQNTGETTRWRNICISHQWWLNAGRPNINTLLQYGTVRKSNVHNLSLSDVSISVGIGQKAGSPPGIQRSFGQNN